MQPLTGSNKLYHITQDGIVIARTDRLRAFDRHILEVTVMIMIYIRVQEPFFDQRACL